EGFGGLNEDRRSEPANTARFLLPIPIKPPHGGGVRPAGGETGGAAEVARAIPQQNRHIGKAIINDDVLLAIAIEIAYRYRLRTTASAELGGGTEVARTIAQQDRHAASVDNGQILFAIAIEITYCY